MFKLNQVIFLILIGLFCHNANATNELSIALQQTQECLKKQNCDSAKSSAGQAADQKALDAVGGNAANKQELYNLSAEILPILVQQTSGDPEKMQALIQKALTDPEAFFNSLPADTQAQIKNLANTVDEK
ncbi:MAG: hypothetical protein KA365_07730 [Arenimonas sp.]|nr:hypothetical protein [Arenimonas sp.]